MTDKNDIEAEGPQNEPQDAEPTAPFINAVHTAEGLGEVIDQAFARAEEYQRPQLQYLTSPDDNTKMPVAVGKDGLSPINPGLFDPWRAHPLRRQGTAELTDLNSLIDLTNRFSNANSALFACDTCDNRKRPSLTSIIDYHDRVNGNDARGAKAAPRHAEHRAEFHFPLSDEWNAWTVMSGTKMSMVEFSMFLEDRIVDVMERPDKTSDLPENLQRLVEAIGTARIAGPGKLLELANGLKVFENSVVKEAHSLSSGEGEVQFQSEHLDENGGKLLVPNLFLIGVPVFNKGEHFRLAARLRYRKTASGLSFWFDLWRPDMVFDTAFTEACEIAKEATGLPLFYGAPETMSQPF